MEQAEEIVQVQEEEEEEELLFIILLSSRLYLIIMSSRNRRRRRRAVVLCNRTTPCGLSVVIMAKHVPYSSSVRTLGEPLIAALIRQLQ